MLTERPSGSLQARLLCAVNLLGKVLHTLQTTDARVVSLRQLGLTVFGCWTLLRFKEAIVKSFVDESLQVGFLRHLYSTPLTIPNEQEFYCMHAHSAVCCCSIACMHACLCAVYTAHHVARCPEA